LLRRIGLVALGLLLGLVLIEVVLRIWTNPFGYRVRGDEIILPVHVQYIIRDGDNPTLDPVIIHTKNSLGFRGPEPPGSLDGFLSIITVGGSTTEQLYISDGFTWTEILAEDLARNFPSIWVNNAGFVGHSTYGHQVLLDDVIGRIRPDVIIYLVGANELGRTELGPFDQAARADPGTWTGLVKWTTLHSETAALIYNLARAMQARRLAYAGGNLDLFSLPANPLSPDEIESALAGFRGAPLESYRIRLTDLIWSTRAAGIEPVLLTQPALYGEAVDPTTGLDLGPLEFYGKNSAAEWAVLELYNDVTRRVAEEEGVFLIDLAAAMPKDSQYYRDMIHYTNEGSVMVAEILFPDLCRFLASEFARTGVPCEAGP
jgi:lysophospholipase L1-like esterase